MFILENFWTKISISKFVRLKFYLKDLKSSINIKYILKNEEILEKKINFLYFKFLFFFLHWNILYFDFNNINLWNLLLSITADLSFSKLILEYMIYIYHVNVTLVRKCNKEVKMKRSFDVDTWRSFSSIDQRHNLLDGSIYPCYTSLKVETSSKLTVCIEKWRRIDLNSKTINR